MDILNLIARLVVMGFCVFLVGLAAVIMAKPRAAERFFGAFASSAATHYSEQVLRLLVGASILQLSVSMRHPELFRIFGWLMIASTIGLLLVPWRWHHRFAARVMPPVLQHRQWFALGALGLGVFTAYSASTP